jgi:hypothetical protein
MALIIGADVPFGDNGSSVFAGDVRTHFPHARLVEIDPRQRPSVVVSKLLHFSF